MRPDSYPSAAGARLLVTMPLLFRRPRLPYFFEQIRCLAEFLVVGMDVAVITNTRDSGDHAIIERFASNLKSSGIAFTVESYWNPDDPKEMTWKHKELILARFLPPENGYTHFVYLEDDMRFTFTNFLYFLRYRDLLRPRGLIPSFLRYEYNLSDHDLYLTDFERAGSPDTVEAIEIDGHNFITPPFPYPAMYVLDRDLALEYAATRSFDMEDSRHVTNWRSTERSAMGLCFENVPLGRTSRFVIPLTAPGMLPSYQCLVHHLPNNFANTQFGPDYPAFGKTRLARAFVATGG